MTSSRRALAWTAAIAVPVVAGAAILVPMAASGAVDLPDKTVEELIAFAGESEVDALSGTIEQTSELGLPDLGALTGSMGGDEGTDGAPTSADIDDLIELVTGSHTAKVYLDGDMARLQVLDQLAERNVYVDGSAGEVWFVDSESASATAFLLPAEAELEQLKADAEAKADAARGDQVIPTPDQMLDQALASLDESTEVTVGTDARVAGRDVYELILTPRTADTLVGQVRFAIDGENGAALAASVTARGASEPAFEIAFTQVDFAAPDAAVFAFEPGEGISVTEKELPLPTHGDDAHADAGEATDAASPVVIGEGWSTVVELSSTSQAGGASAFAGMDPEQLAMLESLTTAVDGGRVLQTSLLTVLITDDGRVLVGAVPPATLVDAAQTGR
ncbi:MAG: LolA family protein [Microbacterium sp.]